MHVCVSSMASTSKVDPYIAMQSRTVAGPVPAPLQSTPAPTPRAPNSMARPVATGAAPAPAGSAVGTQAGTGQGRNGVGWNITLWLCQNKCGKSPC